MMWRRISGFTMCVTFAPFSWGLECYWSKIFSEACVCVGPLSFYVEW